METTGRNNYTEWHLVMPEKSNQKSQCYGNAPQHMVTKLFTVFPLSFIIREGTEMLDIAFLLDIIW